MKLVIVSPQQKNTYLIEWLETQTTNGNIVIKKGHAPLIVSLVAKTTITFLLKTGELKTIYLDQAGFLDINRNTILAIINR